MSAHGERLRAALQRFLDAHRRLMVCHAVEMHAAAAWADAWHRAGEVMGVDPAEVLAQAVLRNALRETREATITAGRATRELGEAMKPAAPRDRGGSRA